MLSPYTKRIYLVLLGVLVILALWTMAPPWSQGRIITIPEGAGLKAIATLLEKEEVVRSHLSLQAFSVLLGGEHRMKAGEYRFSGKEPVFWVAWRIARADRNIDTIKITVPEGFTVEKISKLFDEQFPLFNHQTFEITAPEGYLFPDTYFMLVTATATSTTKVMRDNFVRKIFDLMPEVEKSGKSLEDIVIMASLLEAETKTQIDREMASDVLWKRLKLGMPLQVDSEMGTYEFRGLPEAPINNPGLDSIRAAIHPTSTPYLYFLSGKDGKMHYAKTFEEHQTNIAKYLR